MSIVSAVGHGSTSISNPSSAAICDRCGFRYNHRDLSWQFQWAGDKQTNLRILVCPECLDIPQIQLKTPHLPPDPIPTKDPRPENYAYAANPSLITNWDQSGGNWDAASNSWDNNIQDASSLALEGGTGILELEGNNGGIVLEE